jgi:hypothetical protein
MELTISDFPEPRNSEEEILSAGLNVFVEDNDGAEGAITASLSPFSPHTAFLLRGGITSVFLLLISNAFD